MDPRYRRYVAVETAISLVINGAISAAITWFVFAGRSDIPLAGSGGVLVDFVPQTFMITLMSVLVPTLLTRKRVRSGAVAAGSRPSGFALPRNVLLRGLVLAIAATILLGGAAALLVSILHPQDFDFLPLLLLKIFYGLVVALIVTPFAIVRALGDSAA